VRHAPDHIHIVATLARRDGRGPRIRGDIPNVHTAARAFETAWGLSPMSPLDETARRAPATGEKEKATRRGLSEPAPASLQRTVRQAAALATDDVAADEGAGVVGAQDAFAVGEGLSVEFGGLLVLSPSSGSALARLLRLPS
jgi:hypothetical protein